MAAGSGSGSGSANPAWNWNDDAAHTLGQDFCSDEQLQLAYSKIRQAVAEKQLLLTAIAPTNGRLPLTFANEYTGDGVPISWPALQREVIALSMDYGDRTVDAVTGLWTATGAPTGYSDSDPSSWPPSPTPPNWAYKPVNDGKTPWPGPNGFTRKAPRQIRSMDATYVSGPTVVIANTGTDTGYYGIPPLSYTTGYATAAQEGDVARFTIELSAQATPAAVTDVTYTPTIPALPVTPISDYCNAGRYFKYTSGAWVPYTDRDAPVKALVSDYGPMMIGDYLGTWIIKDLNTAINFLKRVVLVGFYNGAISWPTGMTALNGTYFESDGDDPPHTSTGTTCGAIPSVYLAGEIFAQQSVLQFAGMPNGFYQRNVTILGAASTAEPGEFFSGPFAYNTITKLSGPTLTCCQSITTPTIGSLDVSLDRPAKTYQLSWTAVVLDFDQVAGFQYIDSPQPGTCGGDCPPPVTCDSSSNGTDSSSSSGSISSSSFSSGSSANSSGSFSTSGSTSGIGSGGNSSGGNGDSSDGGGPSSGNYSGSGSPPPPASGSGSGQSPVILNLYNTAQLAQNDCSTDTHWTFNGSPAIASRYSAWVVGSTNTDGRPYDWITSVCGGGGIEFAHNTAATSCTIPAGTDLSTVTVNGYLAVDDYMVDVLVNGVSTGISISAGPSGYSSFNIPPTAAWAIGINTISFVLMNGANPAGISVYWDIGNLGPDDCNEQLMGDVIGTAGSYGSGGNTIDKAFDGDTSTFFDAIDSSADNWVGLDLGYAMQITGVEFYPRVGYEGRMNGGMFQCSSEADFSSDVTTLATLSSAPAGSTYTAIEFATPGIAQYVRYIGPAHSHCNVSELRFFGCDGDDGE